MRVHLPRRALSIKKIGGLHRQEKRHHGKFFILPLLKEAAVIPPLNAAFSALQAFSQKMGITAGNIANVITDGYQKSQAVLEEGRHGEVEVREQRIGTPGFPPGPPESGDPAVRESSNVALEEEIPELITTVYGFKANLKTVKAQDEMLGHLLNIVT
jgi:flagellar basal-body rod protein FlgC